jgi:sugar (pentulose or hexulose) kinase
VAAEQTGLSTATEVIVGTGDSFTSLVGAGIRDAHELMLYWGTSGTRIYTRASPAQYLDGPYFNGGKAEFVGTIFSCGESLNQVKTLMGNLPWKTLDAQAASIPAGAENLFYLPHLKQQSSSGSLASADHIIGLRDKHCAGHLHRALLEGIAYTSVMELSALDRIDRTHVCGGAASCGELRAILATLLKKPVHYSPDSSAALGIALLASLSLPDKPSFLQTSREWFQENNRSVVVVQEPREDWIAVYEQKLETFSTLRRKLWDDSLIRL